MDSVSNKINQDQYEVKHITVEPLFQPIRNAVIEILKASNSTKPMCLRLTGNTDTGKSNFAKIEMPNILNFHDKLKIDSDYGIVVVEITSTISLKSLYRRILNEINWPFNPSDNVSELENLFPLALKERKVGAIAIDEFNQVKYGGKDAIRRLQNMLINIPLKTGRALIIIGRPTMNSLFSEIDPTGFSEKEIETRRVDLNNRYRKMNMPRLNLSSEINIYYSERERKHVFTSSSEIVLSLISDLENHLHEYTKVQSFIKSDNDFNTIETMIQEANGRLGSFVKIWQYSANEAINDKSYIIDDEMSTKGISKLHISDNLDDEIDSYDVFIEDNWNKNLIVFMLGKKRSEQFFQHLTQFTEDNGIYSDLDAIFLKHFLVLLYDLYIEEKENKDLDFNIWSKYAILLWRNLVNYCLNNGHKDLQPKIIKLFRRANKNKIKVKEDLNDNDGNKAITKRTRMKINYRQKYNNEIKKSGIIPKSVLDSK